MSRSVYTEKTPTIFSAVSEMGTSINSTTVKKFSQLRFQDLIQDS